MRERVELLTGLDFSPNAFAVGGTVRGLRGTGLVLQQGGDGNLRVAGDGPFAFADPVASGAPYAVTILAQPTRPTQTCVVTNGSGTVAAANITSVQVACTTNSFTIGGQVTGFVRPGGYVVQRGGG